MELGGLYRRFDTIQPLMSSFVRLSGARRPVSFAPWRALPVSLSWHVPPPSLGRLLTPRRLFLPRFAILYSELILIEPIDRVVGNDGFKCL